MNVFDLPGPQFLVFYTLFAALVWCVIYGALSLQWGNARRTTLLADPYQIACLRVGLFEAARLGIISLVDRGLATLPSPGVVEPEDKPMPRGLHPIEQAILTSCRRPRGKVGVGLAGLAGARRVPRDARAANRMGLAPSVDAKLLRAVLCLAAGAVVVGVGIVKIDIAVDRGRSNVGFLIIEIIVVALFFLMLAVPRPRTPLGSRMLADLRQLLDGRRNATGFGRSGGMPTSEALLLAGIFGAAGLAGFGDLQAAYARAVSVAQRLQWAAAARAVRAARLRRWRRVRRLWQQLTPPVGPGPGWPRPVRPRLAAGTGRRHPRPSRRDRCRRDHRRRLFRGARAPCLRPLRRLAAEVPVFWHGISLGLASTVPVDAKRLDRMARLVQRNRRGRVVGAPGVCPRRRGRDRPPRSAAAQPRLDRRRLPPILSAPAASSAQPPLVENIATLIDPPGSKLAEPEWTGEIVETADAGLLLDLHNLYANAVNFGEEPYAFLRRFPLTGSCACTSPAAGGSTARTAQAGCSTTISTMCRPRSLPC